MLMVTYLIVAAGFWVHIDDQLAPKAPASRMLRFL